MKTKDLQAGKVYAYNGRGRIGEHSVPTRVLLLDTSTWARPIQGRLRPSGYAARRSTSWTGDDVGYPVLVADTTANGRDVSAFADAGLKPDGDIPEGFGVAVVLPRELHPLSVFEDIKRMRAESSRRREAETARRDTLQSRADAAWATVTAALGRDVEPIDPVDDYRRVRVSLATLEVIAERLAGGGA